MVVAPQNRGKYLWAPCMTKGVRQHWEFDLGPVHTSHLAYGELYEHIQGYRIASNRGRTTWHSSAAPIRGYTVIA